MPKELRDMLPADQRTARQLERPSAEILDKAFQMFASACGPLREADKLGMLTFQFPPYFIRNPANFNYLADLRGGAGAANPNMQRALQQTSPDRRLDAERRRLLSGNDKESAVFDPDAARCIPTICFSNAESSAAFIKSASPICRSI
jgi:hypothetical protein